ncbi:hypothetical protein [Vibrio sp. qd031]|uniref:hypothetical protein n=1 Tax=Vibrio sp. qd031 TaxID=1603038 RepID=UPI000A10B337|nr:hypothetical protein [Vibrio sp. qd031]
MKSPIKWWRTLVIAAALCVAMTVSAHAETINVENTGTGASLQQAIDEAVRRSIEQVKGVSIESIRINESSYERDSNKGSNFKNQSQHGQSVTTQGNATYRIISEKCQANECRVRLSVDVSVPDGYERQKNLKSLNKNRRTIAIAPFTGPKAAAIAREVEARFVQDRKFSVLTDLNSTNLDYVLEGRVIEAYTHKSVTDNSRTVKLTGEYIEDITTTYRSKVLLEYKLIDRVNQQVKWSAVVPTTSGRNNLSLLITLSAGKVFDQLKENIYPLMLIKNTDGSLVLNSGGETVKQGQRFDVFSLGEKIIDPITKESLGYNETKVGQVRVSRVLPKLAYVELTSGSLDNVAKHAFVRSVPIVYSSPKTPTPVKPAATKPKQDSTPTRISF